MALIKKWGAIVLLFWALGIGTTQACDGVCVTVGSQLMSLESSQSALLSPLLTGLLGTDINLSVLDWEGLAGGDVNLLSMLEFLQMDLGLTSPEQVLDMDLSLVQVLTAIKSQAVETATVQALDQLLSSFNGLAPIRLGDLLKTSGTSALTDVDIGMLPFITGLVQLFNHSNMVTTPEPITIDGAALTQLGLPSTLPEVQIYAQVVSPPTISCGEIGSTFHTSQIRLKADLDLSEVNILTDTLNQVVSSVLDLPGLDISSSIQLDSLSMYLETAQSSSGSEALGATSIEDIDYVQEEVTLFTSPGIAALYLGEIDDAVFFNRDHIIDPTTDVLPAQVGSLSLQARTLFIDLLDLNTALLVQSVAEGSTPLQSSLLFAPPYPQTQVAGNSAIALAELVDSLSENLTLELDDTVILNTLLNAVLLTAKSLISEAISPLLEGVATLVLDPLLSLLGVGVGEVEVTTLGPPGKCTRLQLSKSVWNVTQNKNGDTALPGDILRYFIQYENDGNQAIFALSVQDTVPTFTALIDGSLDCSSHPQELPSCQTTITNESLQWAWSEDTQLHSGSFGHVLFEVTVD